MITLTDVEKTLKKGNTLVHVLKGINLNIEQGTIFGILGRMGSGKSDLIRCINLLTPPSRGAIMIDSCNLTTLTPNALRDARRTIGIVFQQFNLLDSRNVFDNVALPLEISGTPTDKIEAIVRPLLELTQLSDKANDYPNALNNAQKQRVAIARALVNQPKILLCEEVTASLDLKSKHSLFQLLRTIHKKLNLTLVLITHELDVIKSLCDRVAVLHEGKIVEQGTALELYSHPKSEVAKEFIKTAARLDIPSTLKNRLTPTNHENGHPIIRIAFKDTSAEEPFIAAVMQQFNISLNIIQAHLEAIQNDKIGIMVAELIGDAGEVKNAMHYLEQNNLHVEVLGYASRIT